MDHAAASVVGLALAWNVPEIKPVNAAKCNSAFSPGNEIYHISFFLVLLWDATKSSWSYGRSLQLAPAPIQARCFFFIQDQATEFPSTPKYPGLGRGLGRPRVNTAPRATFRPRPSCTMLPVSASHITCWLTVEQMPPSPNILITH